MSKKLAKVSSSEATIALDSFVISSDNEFGIGKLLAIGAEHATVSYFKSPAAEPEVINVRRISLRKARFEVEMRVYWRRQDTDDWLAGRLQTSTPVPGTALEKTGIKAKPGCSYVHVRFPNGRTHWIPTSDLEIRWALPLENPLDLLATRTQESPYWNRGRAMFLASLAVQRAVYGGLSGLASASIGLFAHQVRVVRKVLRDPIQRYLLADEVGLGKTIEAGIILKQHLLDNPLAGSVVVVVPEHLVLQWTGELVKRFHLGPFLDSDRVNIISHDDVVENRDVVGQATFLVIDEAHRFSGLDSKSMSQSDCYDLLCRTARQVHGVLLLSATPVLKNEEAFLAMLHLLDPETFDRHDIERFHRLVKDREFIGDIVRTLQDDADEFFLEPALRQLEHLSKDDGRLAELVNKVSGLLEHDEEDDERVSAIRVLRIHLQETYRLHRRILRTRRDDETVIDDLPARDSVVKMYEDPICARASELLDRWRVNASLANGASATNVKIFSEFIEALFSSPHHLAAAMSRRIEELTRGVANAAFEGELQLLNEAVPFLSERQFFRSKAIAESIVAQCREERRCVLFVDQIDDAQTLYEELAVLLGRKYVRRFQTEKDLDDFQSLKQDVRVLVCDHRHEEGLNLQKLEVCVVHADLPLSINRIEQRIGRIDRLGARSISRSVVVVSKGGFCEAWANSLVNVVKVFDRSVAPLQYLLREACLGLMTSLFELGEEAIDELNLAFEAVDGPLGLENNLAKIRAQEALDLLDSVGDDSSVLFSQLESFEYGEPSKGFQKELESWAVDNLKFGALRCKGRTTYKYEGVGQSGKSEMDKWIDPVSEGSKTLLPPTLFHNLFCRFGTSAPSMDGSYSRRAAEEGGVPLFRIGHPFVDGLAEQILNDERGIAYAMWRQTLEHSGESSVDLYYRFDFMAETDLGPVRQAVNDFRGVSIPSVQRRADEAFAPFFATIWLDPDLIEVKCETTLGILQLPYKSRNVKDTNLRSERWASVEKQMSLADWSDLCYRAGAAARKSLEDSCLLKHARNKAVEKLERRFLDDKGILVSRISRLSGHSRIGEERTLEIESAIYAGLLAGINRPLLRLSAVGAIFLSSHSPFVEGACGADE